VTQAAPLGALLYLRRAYCTPVQLDKRGEARFDENTAAAKRHHDASGDERIERPAQPTGSCDEHGAREREDVSSEVCCSAGPNTIILLYCTVSQGTLYSHIANVSTCYRIPLNDDHGEKVARLHSRHALQEIQMNEIRAAVSPMRKLNQSTSSRRRESNYSNMSDSPQTPRTQDYSHTAQARKRGGPQQLHRQSLGVGVGGSMRNSLGHGDNGVTPMKRVPILANFEEWMKMATDNKINAANSWNFALIDYFHDMSLLKEGDGVNFQKASCTLDGCVKIYTSRVDSVATETGRLLSGLADGGNESKKGRKGDGADGEEDDEGEEGEEGEDGEGKKKKKKPARSHEATLAASFASFQGKKLELEFAVDPLFKKASADFDEGGAKGLLLNHLSIDSEGRIVFDSSDDAGDAALGGEKNSQGDHSQYEDSQAPLDEPTAPTQEAEIKNEQEEQDEEIDLNSLAAKFFPDMSLLDAQDICPSLKSFTLGDPSGDLSIPFLKAPEDWKEHKRSQTPAPAPPIGDLADQTGIFLDGSNAMGFDEDDDGGFLGGFEVADNVGFGEGGEAWAREAAVDAQARVANADDLDDNLLENGGQDYAVSLQHKYQEDAEHESIMAYFDKAFNSRAKGKTAFMSLENWRMQKIQKAQQAEVAGSNSGSTRPRKEKEPLEIDFLGPMSEHLQELLEQPPVLNSSISLPKAQWRTKGRNLLDKDDEVIDPRKLMRLWTKPKCRVGRLRRKDGGVGMGIIDEGFGARNRLGTVTTGAIGEVEDDEGRKGDYDANFFDDDPILPFDGPLPIEDDDDDDGMGGDDGQAFMDAREMLSPQPESQQAPNIFDALEGQADEGPISQQSADSQGPNGQLDLLPGSFGTQLVTQAGKRLRPEYVNYARTAKKVDVRRLKENMWKGMETKLINVFDRPPPQNQPPPQSMDEDVDMMDIDEPVIAAGSEPPAEQVPAGGEGQDMLNFTEVIQDLRTVYPDQQMKDISTSYCFICLLHLANEKGLILEGDREGEAAMQEIRVMRDPSVGEGYEGE
jgi:condensin complex subunit 2